MTEDEAKIKRCCGPEGCGKPDGYDSVHNATSEFLMKVPRRYCIGSMCMAWQWNQGKDNVRQYVDDNGLLIVESGREGMGYCGLASRRADHERL